MKLTISRSKNAESYVLQDRLQHEFHQDGWTPSLHRGCEGPLRSEKHYGDCQGIHQGTHQG